jgi:DNA-binding NarL/FixJ family response regulator
MTEKPAGKRIYVVDDHPLMRDSLVSFLNAQPDIAVCGAAGSASLAIQEIVALRPHLAIIDLSLADSSGLELIKTIKAQHPQLLMIVYSMHDENLYAERCIRSGAHGYVMKNRPARQVIDAVRDVLSGKISVSEQLLEIFFERSLGKTRQEYGQVTSKLSDRELEIFDLLGRGSGTRQIAENLNLSIKTVQTYAARIKQKLCLSTGTELLREATLWHDKTT